MIRKRILLASLLKPVTDPRMFQKLGRSLAQIAEVEVHVAGYASTVASTTVNEGITLHPVFTFRRLSWGRLAAQKNFWDLLQTLKPDLLIVGTHELLPLAWLYCRRHACRLVYDVRENYHLNLTTQQVYPKPVALAAGKLVQTYEKLLAGGVDHFLLAEEAYARELSFLGNRITVLQNKYLPPPAVPVAQKDFPISLQHVSPLRLFFSGTISRLYGVLEAVDFTRQLREHVPNAQLTIIGYCADQSFLKELQEQIEPLSFVTLIGGERLVPHDEILAQERQHHVGLLPYHPHPSTFTCIPTKLYEYIGNGLVVLAQENPLWQNLLEEYQTGFCHSFSQGLNKNLVNRLINHTYYTKGIPENVFWREEERVVQQLVIELLEI